MIYGISLIILGILAAPSLLLSRKPNAKELLDKLTPYQGWVGLVFCIWGVWGIIQNLLNLDAIGFDWAVSLATNIVKASLGFILGYGMINQLLLSKNDTAKEKGQELLAKLAPIEGRLGLVSICLGAWVVFTSIF